MYVVNAAFINNDTPHSSNSESNGSGKLTFLYYIIIDRLIVFLIVASDEGVKHISRIMMLLLRCVIVIWIVKIRQSRVPNFIPSGESF